MNTVACIVGGWAIALFIPILSLLCGLSAAWTTREQTRKIPFPWREPYCLGVLLFCGVVLTPLAWYLMASYPAWSLLHFVEAERVTGIVIALFLIVILTAGPGGYLLGAFLFRRKWDQIFYGATGVGLAALLLTIFLFRDRLGTVLDPEDSINADTNTSSRLGPIFAFALPVLMGGWFFLLAFFHAEARKMRRALAEGVAQSHSKSLSAASGRPKLRSTRPVARPKEQVEELLPSTAVAPPPPLPDPLSQANASGNPNPVDQKEIGPKT
jgi:hypothetical protein